MEIANQLYFDRLQDCDLECLENFWKNTLHGFTAPTMLAIDKIGLRKELVETKYYDKAISFHPGFADRLNASGLKVQTLLQGSWALLLSRYSGSQEVVFGVHPGWQGPLSLASPLPLRVRVTPDTVLLAWLTDLQSQWETLSSHPCGLDQIRAWSDVSAESPLFESVLILPEQAGVVQSGAECSDGLGAELAPHPLMARGWVEGTLRLQIRYDRARFDDASMTRLLGHWQTILTAMVTDLTQTLATVPWLTAAERQQLLVEWNATQVEYPQDSSIHQVFEAQVARSPEAIAVVYPAVGPRPEVCLTYRELNDRANHLAHHLQQLGVGAETFVAIMMARSVEMIVGILGILKAGGAYVPLDPAYPEDRLAFMLADTQAPVLLTQSDWGDRLPTCAAHRVYLDAGWGADAPRDVAAPVSAIQPSHLAYVNYTSGSTGQPKGVAIPHQAVLRLVCGAHYTPLDASRTLLQLAPIAFDAATLEIWGALLQGGRCVLFPDSGLPDPQQLGRVIQTYGVTTLWLTAALFNTIVTETPETLLGVKELLTGGEALSVTHIRRAQQRLPGTQLINGYGPTESTTFTCCHRIPAPLEENLTAIPIGKPIANTQIYILDAQLQPVPIGVPGELYIGGDGLARGYINRPELTAERFIRNPFRAEATARLYKTGDLVRYLPDGTVEFIGRTDDQVKIRGYRIELGEIEAVLSQHETVRDAVVIAREDLPGHKHLVAYVTASQAQAPSVGQLREYLSQRLAAHMVPQAILVLDKIPLTPNGKADRKALPHPVHPAAANFVAPSTAIERALADLWCGVLGLSQVGIDDNFFDLGGTSILGLQLMARVQRQFSSTVRAVKLYQYPTIATLAAYLTQQQTRQLTPEQSPSAPQPVTVSPSTGRDGVAIIGMVGRFPGAQTIAEFWQNLRAGVESTTWFSPEEIDPSVDPALRDDSNYVRARGTIAGAETFDAAFFGISPREAEVMDPQARVFLELAHEALEAAGYTPELYAGAIGLYAGSGQNTYFERHICGRPEIVDRLGAFQTMLANEKDFVTTRTSYKLNLTGPSVSINTACSTSLVAVAQAFQGLLTHQCDLALAGGISITTPQNTGYLYQEGSMLSPDGRCRPFDLNAQGTMFNSGAGIVVLKRLSDAMAEGDRIYAVIKGVGVNNDGAGKVSFTAPSVNGQAAAIAMAQTTAGFAPETISYVETHGTATPLGDPIEIEALTQAFAQPPTVQPFCAIGSLKSNIGHVVAAAGVAGLMKTALALYHKQIPPSLNFTAPNPQIDFAASPFYVNTHWVEWPAGPTPRRAGVSSFGVGGTNAHVVLEEAPVASSSSPSRPCQLLLLSAKTNLALEQATVNLKTYLQQHPEAHPADVAYTLQVGRRTFNHRRFAVWREGAIVDFAAPNLAATRLTASRDPEVVFMFPGQGSQYIHMGSSLYQHEPVFWNAVDQCAEILKPLLGQDLREIIYPPDGTSEAAATALRQTVYTQPALFTIEYALAQLWLSWGVRPAALIGHSIGEFVAACLAGVFSLADGLKLVATRGRLMGELPPGAMLSVRLPAETVAQRLTGEMAIAAINGPSLCVVSGPTVAVAALQAELETEAIVCRPLHTSHAFHSPMMDPILEPFTEVVKTIALAVPQIPLVSTVTANWLTDAQALDPLYWAGHLRATVRFAEGVQTLWQQPDRVLLEVGPRATASTLARQQAKDLKQQVAIASLGNTADDQAEWTSLLAAIGQLWLAGVTLDWSAFYADEYRHRLPLPTYPFERQRYWIDPKPAIASSGLVVDRAAINPVALPTQSDSLPRSPEPIPMPAISPVPLTETRQQQLIPLLKEVLETTSGLDVSSVDNVTTFLEVGLDSLSLTQVALALKKRFKVKITFRHLLEDYPTLGTLAAFLDQSLPADALPAPTVAPSAVMTTPPVPAVAASAAPSVITTPPAESDPSLSGQGSNGYGSNGAVQPVALSAPAASAIATLVAQQLQIMTQQLQLLGQAGVSAPPSIAAAQPPMTMAVAAIPVPAAPPVALPPTPVASSAVAPAAEETAEPPSTKAFSRGTKIDTKPVTHAFTAEQQAAFDRIIARYTSRTPESKRQAQLYRQPLADPRTVSGFTPLLKEIVYPIVIERSSGAKLWDVDGHEYVDLTNGFGLNFFGWSPDFITAAIQAQLAKGMEIGPQTPLAGKVAQMILDLIGMERVAFCNTGSEAVMAAMRLARTVTGRSTIVIFNGGYHGTFDEVIVRSGSKLRSLPAAPGIMPSMFENILVLEYGTPESLEIIRERADELAAVMVEPVQSRRPELQPKAFLQDLRAITEQSGTALIFDEVVTGFRVHPGGAQAYFGIRADLATYGKVVGGGLPIGVVAGKAEYLDALDGGFWQFGDTSFPEVGVTFFAGTFVRHPLALAAAAAVLTRLKAEGPALQQGLAAKVDRFVTHMKQHLERVKAPIQINHFSSFFYVTYPPELPYAGLLFYLLREKGVHIWEHRPCFFTLAHSDQDIELVTRAFKDAVAELQMAGFLPGVTDAVAVANADQGTGAFDRNRPPQPGARLGRDPEGNPAWYIPDPDQAGKYLQVAAVS